MLAHATECPTVADAAFPFAVYDWNCCYCPTGNAYAARKNNPDKSWQQAAYTDEVNPQQASATEEAAKVQAAAQVVQPTAVHAAA